MIGVVIITSLLLHILLIVSINASRYSIAKQIRAVQQIGVHYDNRNIQILLETLSRPYLSTVLSALAGLRRPDVCADSKSQTKCF